MTTKERPILFRAPMVRALLDGSKTQTRRVVKSQPTGGWGFDGAYGRITSPHHKKGKFGAFIQRGVGTDFPETDLIVCPYGQPGDRLWVREAWSTHACFDRYAPSELTRIRSFHYWADGDLVTGKKRPSIHMPRWASRITLEITSVRVERLQDISRGDAMAEGCPFPNMAQGDDPRQWYEQLWGEINGPDSWSANPWVWAIEFKRINQAAA